MPAFKSIDRSRNDKKRVHERKMLDVLDAMKLSSVEISALLAVQRDMLVAL